MKPDLNDTLLQLRRWISSVHVHAVRDPSGVREKAAATMLYQLDRAITRGTLPPLAWNVIRELTATEAEHLGRAAHAASTDPNYATEWDELSPRAQLRWQQRAEAVLAAYARMRHIAILPLFEVIDEPTNSQDES